MLLILFFNNTMVGQGIVCNEDSLNKYEITSDKITQLVEFTKQEYYPYGQGVIDQLIGQTNCAVLSWIRYLTNRDYEAEVFNIHWPAFFSPVPFEESKEVIDSIHLNNKKYFEQCRYNIYPLYANCDVWNLLKQYKILLNYGLTQFDNSSMSIKTECYFPWNGIDVTLDQSMNYMKITLVFHYVFTPSLNVITDNFADMIKREYERSISLLQDEKLPNRIKRNITEGFYKDIIRDYSWKLNFIFIGAHKIDFNKHPIPKRIDDLFSL